MLCEDSPIRFYFLRRRFFLLRGYVQKNILMGSMNLPLLILESFEYLSNSIMKIIFFAILSLYLLYPTPSWSGEESHELKEDMLIIDKYGEPINVSVENIKSRILNGEPVYFPNSRENLENLPPEVRIYKRFSTDKIFYDPDTQILTFKGVMSEEEKGELLKQSQDKLYSNAIKALFHKSRKGIIKSEWIREAIKNRVEKIYIENAIITGDLDFHIREMLVNLDGNDSEEEILEQLESEWIREAVRNKVEKVYKKKAIITDGLDSHIKEILINLLEDGVDDEILAHLVDDVDRVYLISTSINIRKCLIEGNLLADKEALWESEEYLLASEEDLLVIEEELPEVIEKLPANKEGLREIKEGLWEIKEYLREKEGLEEIKEGLRIIKEDMPAAIEYQPAIKKDLLVIKEDLLAIKKDLLALKDDLPAIKEELQGSGEDKVKSIVIFEKSVNLGHSSVVKKSKFSSAVFARKAYFFFFKCGENAYFDSARFRGNSNFFFSKFNEEANFSSAEFVKEVDFSYANFDREANFSSAEIGGKANFSSAEIMGDADFPSVKFSENASFFSTKIGGKANFSSAEIGGKANFSSAEIMGEADFPSVKFSENANFSSAEIGGKVNFSSAEIMGEADFSTVDIGGEADFFSVKFGDDAYFSSARFGKKANFSSTEFVGESNFSSAEITNEADFSHAYFNGVADYSSVFFSSGTNFNNTVMNDTLILNNASLKGNVHFRNCLIHRLVFNNDSMSYLVGGRVDFRNSQIHNANFNDVIFGEEVNFSDVKFGESDAEMLQNKQLRLDINDFVSLPKFLTLLRVLANNGKDTPGKWIWGMLDISLREDIERDSLYSHRLDKGKSERFVANFNSILENKDLYEKVRFKNVLIQNREKDLIDKGVNKLSSDEIYLLNRLLIEDSFPGFIRAVSGVSFRFVTFESRAYFMRTNFLGRAVSFSNVNFNSKANYTKAVFKEINGKKAPIFTFSYVNFEDLVIKFKQFPDYDHWFRPKELNWYLGRLKNEHVNNSDIYADVSLRIQPLSESFEALVQKFDEEKKLSDRSQAYYAMKVAKLDEEMLKEIPFFLGVEWCVWGFLSGYGTKIWWILCWYFGFIVLFVLLHYLLGNFYTKSDKGDKSASEFKLRLISFPWNFIRHEYDSSSNNHRLFDSTLIAFGLLCKFGRRDITMQGNTINWVLISLEWTLGYILLAYFIITLTNTFPLLNRLLSGIF